jgi:hypothetical protein
MGKGEAPCVCEHAGFLLIPIYDNRMKKKRKN